MPNQQSASPATLNFVDRGDPAAVDFATGDLTKDGAWHDLDLSGVIPSDAKLVLLRVIMANTIPMQQVMFREKGNSNTANITNVISNVAVTLLGNDFSVVPDSSGVIEYLTSPSTFTTLDITVAGWWI